MDVIVYVKFFDGCRFFIILYDLVYSEVWIYCLDYVILLKNKNKKNKMYVLCSCFNLLFIEKKIEFFY